MFQIFQNYPGLVVAISERRDGNMKYWNGGNEAGTKEKREKFLNKIGINYADAVSAEIVHENKIAVVGGNNKNKIISGVDGLLTPEKGVFLSVTFADCLPIFLFDPEKEIVGIVHAGWRGLEKNIISGAVDKFKDLGSQTGNILAGIGPAISAENYEIGEDVAEKFQKYAGAVVSRNNKLFLDIKKAACLQLEAAGIKSQNLEISLECTFSNSQKYFSYRRDKPARHADASHAGWPEKIEAMMGVIGFFPK